MECLTYYYKQQGPRKMFQYVLCGDASANGFSFTWVFAYALRDILIGSRDDVIQGGQHATPLNVLLWPRKPTLWMAQWCSGQHAS